MAPNILVIGATGAIGKYITTRIVAAKSSFGRVAIFTSPNTISQKADEIKDLKAQGVEVFVGDIDVEGDVKKAYQGKSRVTVISTSLITERYRCCCLSRRSRGNRQTDPTVSNNFSRSNLFLT